MKIILHCGLHRAASTSLETWLAGMAPEFEARGVMLAGRNRAEGQTLRALAGRAMELAGPDFVADAINAEMAELAGRYHTAIISDENMLGPLPQPGTALFGNLDGYCAAVAKLAATHQTRVVLVLRDHAEWLESLYRVAQFRGETIGFARFSRDLVASDTPFADLLRRIEEATAPIPPLVTSLDMIRRDGGEQFLYQLCETLQLPPGVPVELPRRNSAHHPLACELRQRIARRGGFLVLEEAHGLGAELARCEASATPPDELTCQALAELLRQRIVALPEGGDFRTRLKQAQADLAAGRLMAIQPLPGILRKSWAAAREPLADAATMAALRRRFARDRQIVNMRYAVGWTSDAPGEDQHT